MCVAKVICRRGLHASTICVALSDVADISLYFAAVGKRARHEVLVRYCAAGEQPAWRQLSRAVLRLCKRQHGAAYALMFSRHVAVVAGAAAVQVASRVGIGDRGA